MCPQRARYRPLLPLLLPSALLVSIASGCGAASGSDARSHSQPGAQPTDARRDVMVFAAASLAEVFAELEPGFEAERPGLSLVFHFAGSNTQALQVLAGARADLVATADTESMDRLDEAGLLEPPVIFARNRLALAVPAANPGGLERIEDLARPRLRLVLAGPEVPAGRYAREFLKRNGAAAALDESLSDEADVRGVVGKLLLGEADAGVVYQSDLTAMGTRLRRIPVEEAEPVVALYPAAIPKAAREPEAARALLAYLLGDAGRRALERAGFEGP